MNSSKVPVLLSYAFRPFFLMNGIFAVLIIALWVMTLHGSGLPGATPLWHSHEMLIGFAMAAVAGFSLTAVANWTGRPAIQGVPLALLVVSWLAGRLAMALSFWIPASLVFFLDMLFPVLLGLLLSREIIGGRSRRNYLLIAIIFVVAILNALYQLGAGQWLPGADSLAIYLLIHTLLLLVGIIAGRIVPSFTGNWLRQQGHVQMPVNSDIVNKTALTLTLLVGLAASFIPAHPVTGVLAFVAALVHGLRLARWRAFATLSNPLLFVLHVAYLWLPVGYTLLGCAVFGWLFTPTAALHALTMGAIGSMVLAVTTRVALGHTGRPLHAARLTVLAYWLLMLAILVRVLGPLSGQGYMLMIDLSATAWILSFAIFTWVYWPILSGPRAG
ncbi:MAG: NnrS family protein [Lysobacterales bacterium]